jgi:hypothetical protein
MDLIAGQEPSRPKRIYRTGPEKRRIVERILKGLNVAQTAREKASTPTNFISGSGSMKQTYFFLTMQARATYCQLRSRTSTSNR